VFQTSPTQESCTVGVWAAMDPIHRVVVIDTEGLLGAGEEERGAMTRMLLNVSSCDIFIYAIDTDFNLLSCQIKITVGAITRHLLTRPLPLYWPPRIQSGPAHPAAPQSPSRLRPHHLPYPRRPSP
jgi:hypothetical protein